MSTLFAPDWCIVPALIGGVFMYFFLYACEKGWITHPDDT